MRSWWERVRQSDIDPLVPKELEKLPSMRAPLPVSPQDGMRSKKGRRWGSGGSYKTSWPENGTDAARFLGGSAIALAFHTPRTGTTMADPGCINHAQAAIAFGAALLAIQGKPAGQRRVPSGWGVNCAPAMHPIRETAHSGGP